MSNLSWRTKLLGLFTLVLGASLLAQVFYIVPAVRKQQVEMAQAHQEGIARNIAWEVDTYLAGIESSLRQTAARVEFRNRDIGGEQQTVTQIAEMLPDINSLFVIDAEGWFVSGSVEDFLVYTKKSYADKLYFTIPFEQGRVHFAAPRTYSGGEIVSVAVSVPIESDAGERVGVLLGNVHLNQLIENVANYPLDEKMVVYLVDRESTVVAHSGIDLFALEEGPLSLDFSDELHVQAIIAGEIGVNGEHEHEGVPCYGSYAILESSGWGLVVEAPIRAILAESSLLARRLLSVSVVLFVIALAVSLVLAGQITAERHRAEEALRESEQWLSTTLRSIGDAVIATDAQGLVTLMNPVAEDLTGWDEAEAMGKPLEEIFHIINEQTGERAENPATKVLREGVVVGLANHTVLIAKDGTKRPIADSGAPMRDEEGNVIGTVMVFRDITESKRAEKALRESEEKVSSFMNSAPDAFVLYDPELNLVRINKSGTEMLGLGKQDIGKNMSEISPGLEEIDRYDKYLQVLETGKPFSIVDVVPHPKFGDLHLSLRAFKAGESLGFVVTDTTEFKRMEEQLVRKEKLAVLGQLSGGVGHELRNPLGAIKNAAYFLNMVLEEPEPDVKEMLEILEREVGTSERIISSLLDFARPKPLTRRKVDINEVVQQALSRTTVPENVEVVSQLDEALPTILADPDQLGQVFANIILNGIQAMPEGGRLLVKTSEVSGKPPRSEWVAVSFADTGVGISKENLGRLFEPLFTTRAKGIGLGLAISNMLVEAHGGTIEVESPSTGLRPRTEPAGVTGEVGKGSTFTVRLPLAAGGAEKQR